MKLLIVTQKLDQKDENLGAFYPWFEELAKKVERMVILAGSVGTVAPAPNVQVFSCGKEQGRGKLARVWKFWELFSEHYAGCDAVLFHQIPEFVLAAAPFLLTRKRCSALWYAHGATSRRLRWAERLVDYILTSSPDGFRLPSKKVFHVGQAVDVDRFRVATPYRSGGGRPTLRLLSVGRISPVKDYETILLAAKILKEKWDLPWILSVVGGPLLPRDERYFTTLKTMAAENGLNPHVHFHGSRPFSEIPQLLQEHDLFLNLSRTGSLDKAVLEAMACGLTVISANPAYRSILPAPYFLEHVSPEFLADRIRELSQEPRPNLTLRQVVVTQHSLPRTMERIHAILSTPV